MNHLPAIFNPEESSISGTPGTQISLNVSTENTRWVEFTAHLSQFNQLSIPETREQLELLLANEHDPVKLASVHAGLARCYIGDGNFIKAADTLGHAYTLLNNADKDTQAFILLEMVAFLAIIDNHDKSLLILKTIPMLTQSEYLLKLTDYYELIHLSREGKQDVIQNLVQSANYFREIKSLATLAYHYKNIGNAYRVKCNFDKAMEYYQLGLEIVEENKFQHIKAAIYHDIGMWKFHQGDFEGSIQTLLKTESIADSNFTKSFTNANIAYLYMHKTMMEIAMEYFEKSLNIALRNGVFYLIPGVSYYLGTCKEKQMDIPAAEKYYSQAYNAALELVDHNFECRGDIKRAIKAYIPFLNRHKQSSFETVVDTKQAGGFEFAVDKTLKEIRGIFQNGLFKKVMRNSKSRQEGIDKLGIAQRTYYAARDRNEEFKNTAIPDEVNQFIEKNQFMQWKDINQKFESQVVSYLFAEYGHSKKKLAEKLDVSYSGVIQLTARAKGDIS